MERLTIKERMESGRKQYIEKCRREGIKMGRPSTYRKSDEEYKKRESFIKNLSSQHPEILTWDMIVSEGANFATLRDSQDIIYNDKLIRA